MSAQFFFAIKNLGIQDLGNLLVRKAVEIPQKQHFSEAFRHLLDYVSYGRSRLAVLDSFLRTGHVGGHEVHVRPAALIAAAYLRVQLDGGVAEAAAESVTCLVGGDGEQPRPQAAGDVEPLGREVNLEKRLLENVLGQGPIAQEPRQEVKQFSTVPPHQFLEGPGVPFGVPENELLVGGELRRVGV